jgi:hypothetical protein
MVAPSSSSSLFYATGDLKGDSYFSRSASSPALVCVPGISQFPDIPDRQHQACGQRQEENCQVQQPQGKIGILLPSSRKQFRNQEVGQTGKDECPAAESVGFTPDTVIGQGLHGSYAVKSVSRDNPENKRDRYQNNQDGGNKERLL